jgi:hypothetical protein
MTHLSRLTSIPLLLTLLLLTGCASSIDRADTTQPKSAKGTFGQWFGRTQEASVFYHDFEDVLIPKGMKLVSKDSILFETPRVKTGVLVYQGRVDPVSLFDFFMVNMPKDNWSIRSYFKYNRYLLVFEKPDKDCIITIVDDRWNTTLEISVAPRLQSAGQMMPGPAASPGFGSSVPSGYTSPFGGQMLSD